MKLSLIVPCYNEEECIEKFYSACKSAFADVDYEKEIIFVNDGSTDKTLSLLKKIYVESGDNINIISFSRNFGKEAAMYAGLKAAKGEYLCFIDADLQQRPELVVKMVELLEKHREYDCIATYSKKAQKSTGVSSFVKSGFYKTISRLSGMEFVDGASDFRCFRRNMADAVLSVSEYHRFTKGLFAWVGFNTRYVPYEVAEREAGESKWSISKLLSYSFEGIMAFSTKPLRLPLYFGLISGLFGLVYLIFYLIFAVITHHTFSPTAVFIALLFVFGGAILTALGILGEYVGKIHIQTKNRPVYIASEVYEFEKKEQNTQTIRAQLEYESEREERLKEKRAKLKEKRRREKVKQEIELQKQEQEQLKLEEEKEKAKREKKNKKKKKEQRGQQPEEQPEQQGYSAGHETEFEDDE